MAKKIEAMIDTFCEQQKRSRELKEGNGITFEYNDKGEMLLHAQSSPIDIADLIVGGDYITADLNEDESKVVIDLDAFVKPFIVELTGSSGTLTNAQMEELATSYEAKILCDDEYYYFADEQEGFRVYTHCGRDNQQQAFTKAIYVYTDSTSTITYKTWTRVSSGIQPATILGTTAPATTTAGVKGQFYLDTSTEKLYVCTAIDSGSYTWKEITLS